MFALYDAFIADAMLNPITPLATYEVSTMTGRASAKLERLTNTFPGTGNFRLLYCNASAGNNPTTCLDGPVESACKTTPCYVVPEVGLCRTGNCSGILYGTDAAHQGPAASSRRRKTAGTDTVNFTVTIDGIVTWFPPISVTVGFPSYAPRSASGRPACSAGRRTRLRRLPSVRSPRALRRASRAVVERRPARYPSAPMIPGPGSGVSTGFTSPHPPPAPAGAR